MLAVLYDVHGNLPALDAVLEDVDRAGATAFLLGGDYALFGPWPAETVARLRSLDAEWIRGNGERWTARPEEAPDDEVVQEAIAACREALGETAVAELGELPETVERDAVLFCHASPSSDVRSFWPEPAEDERELLDGVEAGRLVFGHPTCRSAATARGVSTSSTPAASACRSTAIRVQRTRSSTASAWSSAGSATTTRRARPQ